jgi:class 3 adenylate cyclase
MDQANGGQIMITEVVRTLAGAIKDYQYVDQGERRLPGLTEPHQLYEFAAVASLISPLDTEVDTRLEKMEKYLGRE